MTGKERASRHRRSCFRLRQPFILVLTANLAMYGVLGLQLIGLGAPILRVPISFAFLLLVPGYLLLRILRPSGLSRLDAGLYSLGLGITLLMFTGALINAVYPLIGVSRPISLLPIVVTESLVTLALSVVTFWTYDETAAEPHHKVRNYPLSPVLFLLLLPMLSVLGTYFASHDNILILLALFPLLASVPILAILAKFIPEQCYALAVASTSLSLLLQNALVSNYLWGWDIQYEYYLANLVGQHGVWNPAIQSPTNGMLSVAILAPVLSVVTGLDLTWTLKLIYPALFSLVPVVIFRMVQKQFGGKIGLLSALFVSYLFVFYTEMLQLVRQQIAELFLSLILLVLVDGKLGTIPRSILLIAFGASIVVSHYGTSYLFLLIIVAAWVGLKMLQHKRTNQLTKQGISARYERDTTSRSHDRTDRQNRPRQLRLGFVSIFTVLTVGWYIYVSGSSAFVAATKIGSQIANALTTDIFNPQASQGLSIIAGQIPSLLHNVTKWFHFASQAFVLLGLLVVFLRKRVYRLRPEFLGLSMPSLVLWIAAVTIPYFASAINTTRLYQIAQLFLAPFFVVGGVIFFELAMHLHKTSKPDRGVLSPLKAVALFLSVFLLLNSGWAYQIANDGPTSLSMNPELDSPRYNDREVATAQWLAMSLVGTKAIADENRYQLLLGNGVSFGYLYANTTGISRGTCLFAGTYNLQEGVLLARTSTGIGGAPPKTSYVPIGPFIATWSVTYDNGGSLVYC